MNFDPKVVRRALMVAKDLATKIDPGFAVHKLPMPPQGVPLERAKGGSIKTVQSPDREANFQRLFSGTFVSHPDGKPMRVYHSTRNDFDTFDTKKSEFGSHFGPIEQAASFGSQEGRRTVPVYLNIKNPIRLRDEGTFHPHEVAKQLSEMGLLDPEEAEKIRDASKVRRESELTEQLQNHLKNLGYDGVVYLNRREGFDPFGAEGMRGDDLDKLTDEEVREHFPEAQDSYIAFDPHQIKSAVGNVGTFDPANPSITKAEGGAVDDEMQVRNLNPMGMYSAAAEAARNLPQERGTLQQMLATMKGVKPDELRWSGVQDKFAGQKTVTRDELAQHFEQSLPPLRENVRVESATEGPDAKYGQYTLPGGQNYREVVMHMRPEDVQQTYPNEKMSYKSSHWQEPNVVAHLRLKDRDFAPAKKPPKPDTQASIMVNTPLDPSGQALRPVDAWSTSTPGLVVTKSMEPDEKGQYRVTHLGTGLNATGGSAYPFHQAMDAAKRLGEIWDGWTQDPDTVKAWAKENGKLAREALKKASNPFAKKILHIEELQSDWAQQGRDIGFRNAAAFEKANAEMGKWRNEMSKTYIKSLDDRLAAGTPLQPFEKQEMLSGHYQDLTDLRNYFWKKGFRIAEHPLENDEYGLFVTDKNDNPIDDEEFANKFDNSSAIYDLDRMRGAYSAIQNFEKKSKEDPAFRKLKVGTYVAGLSPQKLAERLGQDAIEKTENLAKAIARGGGGHDEGPYVTNTNQWTDLGLKRALVEAARGGYDKLIWTPGEAQADRYKLSNFIDTLEYKPFGNKKYSIYGSKNGRPVHQQETTEEELPRIVGQELAKKIIEGHGEPTRQGYYAPPEEGDPPAKVLKGVDLNIGGRGMYEYYDKILPRRLMALAQEHDPEAQIKPLKSATGKIKNLPSLDITPRMRDSILKRGFKAFKRGGAVQGHLFHHHDEPKSIEVPVMDRERAIRRALMIAKAEGGTVEKPAKVRKTAMDFLPESLPDVSINSLTKAFTEGINEHLALPDKERIQNSRAAKKVIASRNGSGALLAKNGKLMKTETGAGDSDPVELPDGRGIETTGLSLAPAFQAGKFNTCPNHASCKASCLGVTSGGNFMFGGGRDLEEMKGPRLAHLKNTLAMILHPKEFAVRLNDEITSAKQQAAANGNKLGVRLNVLSDLHPRAYEALIKAHPDVDFYDYTKLDSNPIAPNHHLTYSSTGVAQPAGVNGNMTDVDNVHQNWRRMRRRLDTGSNVAMAFSHGSVLPEFVHDLESGKKYRVVNGDDHDFRPMDRQPEGSDGVIVGLKNKKAFGKEQEAHIDSNGFFTYYDPKIVKDAMGNNMVTNNTVQVAPQPGAKRMMTNDSEPEEKQNG